jgi:hypothetical protein
MSTTAAAISEKGEARKGWEGEGEGGGARKLQITKQFLPAVRCSGMGATVTFTDRLNFHARTLSSHHV